MTVWEWLGYTLLAIGFLMVGIPLVFIAIYAWIGAMKEILLIIRGKA